MQDHRTRISRRHGLALVGAAFGGIAGAAASRLATPGHAASTADARVIADWSLAALLAIRAENGYRHPMMASRTLAMMHLAMHDAVNAAMPRFAPYAFATREPGADAVVAAATAAHDVLVAYCPGQAPSLGFDLAAALAEAGHGAEAEQGRVLGAAAARAILDARERDGVDDSVAYTPREAAGAYRYTPGFDFLFAAQWGAVRPFGLRSPDQFRVDAPPAIGSPAYVQDFAEVRTLGARDSFVRTEEQTRLAHFWYEFSDIGWNRVARAVARDRGLDLCRSARLFALVNMAIADGYVAAWQAKQHFDSWRPVTAIRAAGDTGWEPLLPTPPIQDHPSGHATLGAAAAEVMAGLLGDATPFGIASSTALPEAPVRRFNSFSAAARENAESRVLAGLHFRFACEAGLELGGRIGAFALSRHLRPLEA